MIKNHRADSFDGGRAPSILPELESVTPEARLRATLAPLADSEDDEVRALALAILALTGGNDSELRP